MNGSLVYAVEGTVQSYIDPRQYFGMTYHSLMIPPFPMRTVLFLGYGEGQIHDLMRIVWGVDFVVTGVDTRQPERDLSDVIFMKMDAEKFVRECETEYEYICLDLFNGNRIPPFIYRKEFVEKLRLMTSKMLGINCTYHKWNDFDVYQTYFNLDSVKQVNEEKVLVFNALKRQLAA